MNVYIFNAITSLDWMYEREGVRIISLLFCTLRYTQCIVRGHVNGGLRYRIVMLLSVEPFFEERGRGSRKFRPEAEILGIFSFFYHHLSSLHVDFRPLLILCIKYRRSKYKVPLVNSLTQVRLTHGSCTID